MNKKQQQYKNILILGLILTIFSFNLFISTINFNQDINHKKITDSNDNDHLDLKVDDIKSQGTYEVQHVDEWIKNGDFSSTSYWTTTESDDTDDINGAIDLSNEYADYEILGSKKRFSHEEEYDMNSMKWYETNHTNFPIWPSDFHSIVAGEGFRAGHTWNDQNANQIPSVQWEQNFSLKENMSDYIITSASVKARINATVESDLDTIDDATPLGSTSASGNGDVDTFSVGDYIRFYVSISDLEKNKTYEIAYNQTISLGDGAHNAGAQNLAQRLMTAVSQEDLVYYLTSVLSTDHHNFTLIVGIRFNCEDNIAMQFDYDEFTRAVINLINLTFEYEKKIDQLTTLEYNQVGYKINGTKYDVVDANLNFDYFVNQTWPSTSPNSELRIIINGSQHSETIRLNDSSTTPKEAKTGGFDVTSLIQEDVNISLSIQLFIADNFKLANGITASIDNVSLIITYKEIKNEELTYYRLALNTENKTLPKSIQIPIGEPVNVSFKYENSTRDFIDNASVIMTGYGSPKNLTENKILEYYNITIDTSFLSWGENYFTITASKFTYETQEILITIDVTKRDSFIDNILMNQTSTTSIQYPWNETIDISIAYNDTLTNTSISIGTVELNGIGILENFTESGQNYILSINTTELVLGPNILTISASADNHSLTSSLITIFVNERDAVTDSLLNNNLGTSLTLDWNESLNITAIYKDDETGAFISGAPTVQLRNGSTVLGNLGETTDQYELIINTNVLGVGTHGLSIYAKQDNFTSSLTSLTITVMERDTAISTILNGNPGTSLTIDWNENINITAIYEDQLLTSFISGASTIELRNGSTVLGNLGETTNQYELIINTNTLGVGVHSLSVYIKQDNYTAAFSSLTITVMERDTTINTILNGNPGTSLTIDWNENLNITAIYEDQLLTSFISGASTLEFRNESIVIGNLGEITNQYELIINTNTLGVGVHALTVYIKQDNYTAAFSSLTITVTERDTAISTILNGNPGTSLTIDWNENLNITAIYEDQLFTSFISGASTIELRNGSTVLGNLGETTDQYELIINTNSLGVGTHGLTVYIKQNNHTTSTADLTITVNNRDTTIGKVFLNNTDKTSEKSISISWNEILPISISFNDTATGNYIDNAQVSIAGQGIDESLTPSGEYYSYIFAAGELPAGTKVLTITAQKDNYTTSTIDLIITINNRDTTIGQIILNDTVSKEISLTNGVLVNITIRYQDVLSSNFIKNATITIIGIGLEENLTENQVFNQYSIILNTTTDLGGKGAASLTIIAIKTNYSQAADSILITISERGSNYSLIIDGSDLTSNPSIERNINQTIDIKIYFRDLLGSYPLENATIQIKIEGIWYNMTENDTIHYYNYTLNTLDLPKKINSLRIQAIRPGWEAQNLIMTIEIIERSTNLDLYLNGLLKTTEPSVKITYGFDLNITVNYTDTITEKSVENSTVELRGDYIANLTYNSVMDLYNITLNTINLSLGLNFITVYAHKTNYETISILITIEIIERTTNLSLFLNETLSTNEPSIKITYGYHLNISISYTDIYTSLPIENSTVKLLGLYSGNLTYNSFTGLYTIIIPTTVNLTMGPNFISVYAIKTNYKAVSISILVDILSITGKARTESGVSTLETQPGKDLTIRIELMNVEFGGRISNATVTFITNIVREDLREGEFEEVEDGIYEVTLKDVPEGTFTMIISITFADQQDLSRYKVEQYEITLVIQTPPEEALLFVILTILSVCASIGLIGYIIAYQKVLKYPKSVRKIRNYKKSVNKEKKGAKIEVEEREHAFGALFAQELGGVAKLLRAKAPPLKSEKDKLSEQKSKKAKITEGSPKEQMEFSDDLNNDSI